MPGEFANLFACVYGDADFQLTDYSVRESPIVENGLHIGTTAMVSGTGYVEDTDEAAFALKVRTIVAAFRASGRDFRVAGMGGHVEYDMPAAQSLGGGPHARLEVLESGPEPALVKRFRFEVETTFESAESAERSSYQLSIQTRPDDLRVITYTGDVLGIAASDYFATFLRPRLSQRFDPTKWVPGEQAQQNERDDRLSFTLTFTELATPLVFNNIDHARGSVRDGEVNYRTSVDESQRMLESWTWDLLITGDHSQILTEVKPKDGVLLRSSYEFTQYREGRLRAEFTILRSADSNNLLEWEHTLELSIEGANRVAHEYTGRDPDFTLKSPPHIAVQRGRAVTLGGWLKPRPPVFSARYFAEPPRVAFRELSHVEFETTWDYRFISARPFDQGGTVLAQLKRPRGQLQGQFIE